MFDLSKQSSQNIPSEAPPMSMLMLMPNMDDAPESKRQICAWP